MEITPKVLLFDAAGFVQHEGREELVTIASNFAQRPMNAYHPEYKHEGNIRDSQGNTYSYSGTSRSGNNTAVALGNARVKMEREYGEGMLRWVKSYWLANSYEIPPSTATSGALFYPIKVVGKLPLHLVVDVNGKRYEFSTQDGKS